jgi:antitoxin (DNA-binding transcriptional repressor) of toxin-antitoxin stability system
VPSPTLEASEFPYRVDPQAEIVVTMRGRQVARLVPVDGRDALADLRSRGLVREPTAPRRRRTGHERIVPAEPVSDLVADQRR